MAEPQEPQPTASRAWYHVWWMALTNPRIATYELLMDEARTPVRKALLWIFSAAFVTAMLLFVEYRLLPSHLTLISDEAPILRVVLMMIEYMFWPIMYSIVCHLASRALGGRGKYSATLYILAALFAPLFMLRGLFLAFVPGALSGMLSLGLGVLRSVLIVISLQAVYGLPIWRTVVTGVIIPGGAWILIGIGCDMISRLGYL